LEERVLEFEKSLKEYMEKYCCPKLTNHTEPSLKPITKSSSLIMEGNFSEKKPSQTDEKFTTESQTSKSSKFLFFEPFKSSIVNTRYPSIDENEHRTPFKRQKSKMCE
jgi:hypothetical protein